MIDKMYSKIETKMKNKIVGIKEKLYSMLKMRSEVYKLAYEQSWNNKRKSFSSGAGTRLKYIKEPYVKKIKKICKEENLVGKTFVDLGCGDFEVGNEICELSSIYIGVDIVDEVIKQNREQYNVENVKFLTRDIVDEELPNGDVAFLRQVLQHMSNKEIQAVLEKIDKYDYVFITEHYPIEGKVEKKNIDIKTGRGTRLSKRSAVFLNEEPFNLDDSNLTEILSIDLKGPLKGQIKTFMYVTKC